MSAKNVTPLERLSETSLANDLEFLMARALALGTFRANAALKAHGLRVRSYSVLSLACSSQSISQKELADFLRLDASQIVSLVDELEESGLIQRQTDSRDRRSNVIVATALGEKLYLQAQQSVSLAEESSLESLSPTEKTELRRLLTLIAF